jgi:hypothetical protein
MLSAKGVNLTLLVGPAVPIPVPQVVLDALTSVEVTTTAGHRSPSGFQLTFNLSTRSPLHTLFLVSGASMIPLIRVMIVATVNGTPEVLIDGVMTKQDVSPGSGPGQSTLKITGVDLTGVMGLVDFSGLPYPAMTVEARVLLVLAKYALFGMVPMVVPTLLMDVPIPVERIPIHQGNDLEYVNQLADEVGYVFYVSSGPVPGLNVAYWGPEIRVGVPQKALNLDMGPHTNCDSLTFTFDAESRELPVVYIHNALTKAPIPIPIPDLNPLRPPLGLVPPLPLKINPVKGTAKMSPMRAAMIGIAKAAETSDAVSGNGTLDVVRYGRVLKARQLVGVRGVGPAFDGLYFVKSVTSTLKRGEFKQSFTLTRNGLISTVPRVPA